MKPSLTLLALLTGSILPFAGCANMMAVQMGDDSARTAVTGAAAGSTTQNANAQIERCDKSLGTLAVVEDQTQPWFYQLMRDYQLTSTVPLIRMLIQQSNCFVVVDRGRAFNQLGIERQLRQTGELRSGSNMGPGQMVAADYSMSPMISFSQRDSAGLGTALAFVPYLGMLGALAGNLRTSEASTTLALVDNRSGVQLAAAEGSSSKTDFSAWSGVFSTSAAGGLGGYTNTAEGKLIAAAFADAYNRLVSAVRNYQAQEVKGGLGTGGELGVKGGTTPASKALETTKPATAPIKRSPVTPPKMY
jgi:hypothetical protein